MKIQVYRWTVLKSVSKKGCILDPTQPTTTTTTIKTNDKERCICCFFCGQKCSLRLLYNSWTVFHRSGSVCLLPCFLAHTQCSLLAGGLPFSLLPLLITHPYKGCLAWQHFPRSAHRFRWHLPWHHPATRASKMWANFLSHHSSFLCLRFGLGQHCVPLWRSPRKSCRSEGSPEGSRHYFPDGLSGSESGDLHVAEAGPALARAKSSQHSIQSPGSRNFAFSLADGGELSTDGEFCNKIHGSSQIFK